MDLNMTTNAYTEPPQKALVGIKQIMIADVCYNLAGRNHTGPNLKKTMFEIVDIWFISLEPIIFSRVVFAKHIHIYLYSFEVITQLF